jgi:hypothetical protein
MIRCHFVVGSTRRPVRMATKKKTPIASKVSKANLSGGGGQGGHVTDLKGGGGPAASSQVKKTTATRKK